MLRKESEVVSKGNGPVHQQDEFGSDQPTLVDPSRKIEEIWDRTIGKIMSLLGQHLTSLEPDARQPRLAMETDGPANLKTRKRTEGAATAVQAMHGDSCSATRVEPGLKTNSASFGMMAEPPDLPCRKDVWSRTAMRRPKSCLPSLEVRSPTAAGGLLPTGKISTATKTTFNKTPLRLYSTEETNPKETNL